MKALTYIKHGKFALTEKPKPEIVDDRDAIVRVILGSICTSDLHIKHGSVPRAVPGITVGHELVGVVEAVGSDVTTVRPGDRVTVNVETFCGECFFCKHGFVNNCTDPNGGWALGCRIDGGQAEFVRVPYRYKLEDIEEAYRIFENKLDGVIKIAIVCDRDSNIKQTRYQNLIERVRTSYPIRDSVCNGKDTQLYWCEDCKEINLWTYWQGRNNLDAKIILVGQDWGCPWDQSSQNTMKQIALANKGEEYHYLDQNPSITDYRLIRLFQEIGYEDISKANPDLFFTNFILGYRSKGISGGYQQTWADHDKRYFHELANIIEAKVILCLGRSTFEGVLSAFDTPLTVRIKDYNAFIEGPDNPVAVSLENGQTAYVFALAHCGAMGTLNRNGKKSTDLSKQIEDWRKIKPYLDK